VEHASENAKKKQAGGPEKQNTEIGLEKEASRNKALKRDQKGGSAEEMSKRGVTTAQRNCTLIPRGSTSGKRRGSEEGRRGGGKERLGDGKWGM